jgi:hypothetical protein
LEKARKKEYVNNIQISRDGNIAKYMAKSSPKKSLPGGLNIEEIL